VARRPTGSSEAVPERDKRKAAVEALMALAAERRWSDIGLADIARGAGLSLSELRALFASKGAILAAFSREIDRVVLDGIDVDMAGEPARERLFDTLMRRIDALAPYRAAIAEIRRALAQDLLARLAMSRVMFCSMQWMLTAASIGSEGPIGALRAKGLTVAWARILRVWLDDDDEGLARTMTEVDRQLRSGERWMERLDDVCRLMAPLRRVARRSARRRARFRDDLRERFEDHPPRRRRRRQDPDDDTDDAGAA